MLTFNHNQGIKADSLGRPVKPCGSLTGCVLKYSLLNTKGKNASFRNISLHPSAKDMGTGTNYCWLAKVRMCLKAARFPCSKSSLSTLAALLAEEENLPHVSHGKNWCTESYCRAADTLSLQLLPQNNLFV